MTLQRKAVAGAWLAAMVTAALVPTLAANAADGPAPTYDAVVALSRQYMDTEDAAARAEILQKIGAWDQRLDEVALALRPVPPANAPTGYLAYDKFTVPRLRAKMAALAPGKGAVPAAKAIGGKPANIYYAEHLDEEHLTCVLVPEDYRPDKPLGLLIFLHGGGGEGLQTDLTKFMFPRPTEPPGNDRLRLSSLALTSDLITIAPSTPPQAENKFSFPESEIHMAALIEEYSTRYAIDPDRIYLYGGSMGGIGCFHQALRHPDRFAVIAPGYGDWRTAYWRLLRGTTLFLNGCALDGFDRRGQGNGTPVGSTRVVSQCLAGYGIPFLDAESVTGHGARPQMEMLFDFMPRMKRDPYAPRVCAVGPGAPVMGDSKRFPPQPYNRWVSVTEIGPGSIPTENVSTSIPQKSVTFSRGLAPCGAADAENLGGNRFRVTVTNVRKFRLWLHPKMGVDLTKPIEVEIVKIGVDRATKAESEIGRSKVSLQAKPSLQAMLQYLGDRRDYGLIYHAMIEIAVPE